MYWAQILYGIGAAPLRDIRLVGVYVCCAVYCTVWLWTIHARHVYVSCNTYKCSKNNWRAQYQAVCFVLCVVWPRICNGLAFRLFWLNQQRCRSITMNATATENIWFQSGIRPVCFRFSVFMIFSLFILLVCFYCYLATVESDLTRQPVFMPL